MYLWKAGTGAVSVIQRCHRTDIAQAERVIELRQDLSLVDVCSCLRVNAKEGLLLRGAA